jgi:fatty acid kinase fatty acid binding subunit
MVIVAGSALQLRPETVKDLGIEVVNYPMYLNGEPYPVSMEMSREEKDKLRLLLKDKNNKVTTSGLVKGDLMAAYSRHPGEKIISIHQAARASTATMTMIQDALSDNSDLDVEYVDAKFLTAAYTILVQEAALAVKAGKSFEEVMALITKMQANTRHLGVVYDLFYLHRTGRIGLAKAVMGTAMKIIALLSSSEVPGTLISVGKAKNHVQANQRFIKIIQDELDKKNGTALHAVISVIGPHEEEAEHLRQLVDGLEVDTRVEVHYTNHSNMPHAGPDFYDIGYVIYA